LLNHSNGGILQIIHAEKNFKVWVILPAETCIVFVGFAVKPANRFQNAYGRRELAGRPRRSAAKTRGSEQYNQVINQRESGHNEHGITYNAAGHRLYPLPMNTSA